MNNKPTLHREVPMGSRVICPPPFTNNISGTVVGISFCHVIFTYIVLLDIPIESEWGVMKAICVPGPQLERETGGNWRLPETDILN